VRLTAMFVLAVWLPVASMAQVDTSTSIRGLVKDLTGAMVPGAKVTVQNKDTNEERATTTDASGFYAFPSLLPGTYNVVVTHSGFKRAEVAGRVAEVTESAQVDFVLQIGEASQSVTVSAAGAEMITTTSTEIGSTINANLVENIPLNGGDFFALASVMPYVSMQSFTSQLTQSANSQNLTLGLNSSNPMWRDSGVFSAGNRDSATSTSIDGLNVQSARYGQTAPQEPTDSIEEMRVHVSSMNAEFGYGVGAMNIVTKSGTNKLHGSVYEYFRNQVLDANDYFSNSAGRARAPWRQNQFGASAGAPIMKNKLFFFVAYEGLRVRQSSFSSSIQPPPATIRTGNFSNFHPNGAAQAVPPIYDPSNYNSKTGLRTPFPGNQIPQTRDDPVTLNFLNNWVEMPNATLNGQSVYEGNGKQTLDEDQGLARIDYTLSTNARIYGRFGRMISPGTNYGVESLTGTSQLTRDLNGSAHWTQILSASTVSDVMLGYSRPYWFGARQQAPDVDKLIGLVNEDGLSGGPNFSGTGYSMNATAPQYMDSQDNSYQFSGDLTHVHGRHSLKFGIQAIERRTYSNQESNDRGVFAFSTAYTAACPGGLATCVAAMNAAGLTAGGNAFASFLLGLPSSISLSAAHVPFNGQRMYYGLYAQDSWRVSARLTLNYGVRYELYRPWQLVRHTADTFNLATGQIEYVLQNPDDYLSPSTGYGRNAELNPYVPVAGYTQGSKNFGPRAGLAYSFFPKTVFRAGYGIYFDGNAMTNELGNTMSSVGPFTCMYAATAATNEQVPSLKVNGSFPPCSPTAIPSPNINSPAGFAFVWTHIPIPTVQEWSASIQQGIGRSWTAEVSYQGTHSVHANQLVDVNAPVLPQGALAALSINQRREFPQWAALTTYAPIGYSRYNAAAVSVRNMQWHGLTLMSSFTFAKNISSYSFATNETGNEDIHYAYIWQGPSALSPALSFVNSYSYQLPYGRNGTGKGIMGRTLGGWMVTGVVQLSTGNWNWVTTNTDTSSTGYGTLPDRVCDARNVPGGRTYKEWFNPSCFIQSPTGTFGNSGMGVYENPGIDNWNISFRKSTRTGFLSEYGRIDFIAQLFNAFNHTQWGPATNQSTAAVGNRSGTIVSTRPPRDIQLSMKYIF
jgi:hypothetical protein